MRIHGEAYRLGPEKFSDTAMATLITNRPFDIHQIIFVYIFSLQRIFFGGWDFT